MSIINKLKKKEKFTFVESTLADYIINNIDEAYKMSLQDLADVSHVSKPSVIRLYRKVGCQSYREFSLALQLEKIRLNNVIPGDSNLYFLDTDDLYGFSMRLATICKQTVENFITSMSPEYLEKIISTLDEAEKIYFFSDSFIQEDVRSFISHLKSIGFQIIFISNEKDSLPDHDSIKDGDVLLICTDDFSEAKREMLEKIAEYEGTKLLITTSEEAQSILKSDLVFNTYPDRFVTDSSRHFLPHMSLLLGLNVLEACLYKRRLENEHRK